MEIVSYTIKRKQSDRSPIVIAPIGDVQYTGKNGSTAIDTLKRHIEKCQALGAWYISMGDMTDFASPSNRQRLRAAALYDSAETVIDDSALNLILELYNNVLKPTKGRWLACLCVPLQSEILTKTGWKHYNEVVVGEEVLGYDFKSDMLRWTMLQHVYVSAKPEPLVQMASMAFSAICTPQHTWVSRRRTRIGTSHRDKWVSTLVATEDLKTSHQLCVTTKAESGTLTISPREAAVLGWIVTDGTIFTHRKLPSQNQAFIYQSKPKTVSVLRKLLRGIATENTDNRPTTIIRERGQERTIRRKHRSSRFYIKKSFLFPLFKKLNFKGPGDLPRIILNMPNDARQAMFEAMRLAEGTSRFYQNPGAVLDSFVLLATLLGYRLGVWTERYNNQNLNVSLSPYTRKYAGVACMQFYPEEPNYVWCPQTALGTWVMRQGTQITITGNSGHHYHVLKHGDTTDMRLAQLLDARFVGTSAFIRIQFEVGTQRSSVVVFCHHGVGSGQKSFSPLNKLENIAPFFDADIYLMGHQSKMATSPINRVIPRFHGKGAPDLVHKKIVLVGTGGFSKAYVLGATQGQVPKGGYAEEKLLSPAVIGAPLIYIRPDIKYVPATRGQRASREFTYEVSVEV